jgi:uncharacterized protein
LATETDRQNPKQAKQMISTVDTWDLARLGREQRGEAALASFARLLDGLPAQAESLVSWAIAGQTDALQRRYITLRADATVRMVCQRCLAEFDLPLHVETRLQLVETEAEIQAEESGEDDPEAPDQVLGSSFFDVLSLVEDELILALPYVPKHEVCPSLPKELNDSEGGDAGRPSPFAVLAKLKKD